MLEQETHKRPKAMDVQLRLKEIQQGKVLSYFWGLLIGSFPYPLLLLLSFFLSSVPQISTNGPVNTAFSALYFLFLCTWPFVLIGQYIAGIRFLLSPPRRMIGLGIITMLVLFLFVVVAAFQGWIVLPPIIFPSWDN
jgi:hypothetical protein